MRRAAVPIVLLATFTLIVPSIGVAVTPSPSRPASVSDPMQLLLRVSTPAAQPDAALEQVATARPGARAARALIEAARPKLSPLALTHTVVHGESLWSIAHQYGVAVGSLAWANRLTLTSILPVERVVLIPPQRAASVAPAQAASTPAAATQVAPRLTAPPEKPVVRPAKPKGPTTAHIVQPGETLWKIATDYGQRVEDVMAWNGLGEDDVIKPGQKMIIAGRPPLRPRQTATERPKPATAAARIKPAQPASSEPVMAVASLVRNAAAFLWPTRGVITSRFGWRRYRRHHEGIDLAAPHGTPIYATRDGVVTFSGWRNGYGQVVYIDHGDGLTTIYGHASELHVAAGQQVKRGQIIARVGCTGYCTGAHVHFEVRINGIAVNPLQYLR